LLTFKKQCIPSKETQQNKQERLNLDIIDRVGSKLYAFPKEYSAPIPSAKSTKIDFQKCPLVKIITYKSYQKSNDFQDLYNNTNLDVNLNFDNSFNNYVDDFDCDDYFDFDHKETEIQNFNSKVALESKNYKGFYSSNNNNQIEASVDNGKNEDIGERKNFFRNSELSFNALKKVQFDYESQSKVVNDISEFKFFEGKEKEFDGKKF
jgi:hypothetical protein